MNAFQAVENLLPALTQSEKARLLQQIVNEIGGVFPGIESDPAVNGGDPSIVRTRIPIWLLAQAHEAGATDAQLLDNYPTLRAEDLFNAWSYYRAHKSEIEAQIRANEDA